MAWTCVSDSIRTLFATVARNEIIFKQPSGQHTSLEKGKLPINLFRVNMRNSESKHNIQHIPFDAFSFGNYLILCLLRKKFTQVKLSDVRP